MFVLLAGQEASCLSLEGDDDDGQFEVPLLLQLGQNPRPEEHLTLTDTIQVSVQIQVLYLKVKRGEGEERRFVNENGFYGYPRVSPLHTCSLNDNHMQLFECSIIVLFPPILKWYILIFLHTGVPKQS